MGNPITKYVLSVVQKVTLLLTAHEREDGDNMDSPDQEKLDLEKIIEKKQKRLDFLELSILLILMNPNLYELLQQVLCHGINSCAKSDNGETILQALKMSENWAGITGPEDVDDQTLDDFTHSLYTKLTSYRKHGNFNG